MTAVYRKYVFLIFLGLYYKSYNMRYVFNSVLFFICSMAFAQVGINTSSPDPSAMLEVFSDTAGMLTPRMTSIQKLDIASPANGLLVYDTSLNAFQYYDGTSWDYISKTKFRTNFKLVKNIADLAEELAAGGGTTYVLKTDHLYEINGVVTVDFPIDLNGAYIQGIDTSEDKLVNNSAGSLFQGNGGGSLRNLTLSGNGRQLFNITGTGGDILLISNSIFAGASRVGTLSGLGTVFISVSQYLGNADGFTIDNIGSFFMSNVFWPASNTGTFMEFTGTFNNLQMNAGRVESNAGETGIDVSSNPTIVNNASLSQLSFVGLGNYVQPYTVNTYTGYNFTKDWDVNCPGIPTERDQTATANIYYGGTIITGYVQTITSDTAVQIKSASNFVATGLFRFRADDNNNDVIYEGKKSRTVQVNVSLSVRVTEAAGNFYAFAIAKNGVVATETNSTVIITGNTQIQNVSLNGVLTLVPGDRIEIFAKRLTGSGDDDLVVFSQNLSIR